jgi:hypothetical protein
MNQLVASETVERRIFLIRGKRVMVDRDLAELYGVQTRALNQAVKRNERRFPEDFAFRLTKPERDELVTICDRLATMKHSSAMPLVFTENGVAMLSSVLNSEAAIDMNIVIMRAFVRLREIAQQSHQLWAAIQKIEKHLEGHDHQIRIAFDALKSLMKQPLTVKVLPKPLEYPPPGQWPYKKDERKRMGFAPGKKGGPAVSGTKLSA